MRYKTILFIVLSFFMVANFAIAQEKAEKKAVAVKKEKATAAKINWVTWEEAEKLSKTEKKKIFVDVYTNWCGWCKRMDATTFSKSKIVEYMNENYYCIKFNAESPDPITFNGKTYKFVKTGRRGYHELAAKILNGRMSYPTIVFIDEELEVIQPIPGYRNPEQLETIAAYFATDSYKTIPWATYEKEYNK